MRFEPSNPEVFVIASFTNRFLHRWDDARDLVRIARQLDPLSTRYPMNEARVEICADRPAAGERAYRQAIDAEPENAELRDGLVRSLALQGKFDTALDLWRADLPRTAPPALVAALTHARGQSGYYAARHMEGRLRFDAFRRASAGQRVPRLRTAQLQLEAGDSAAGFASLDSAVHEGAEWLFRLPCFSQVDEYRATPRYRALLARVGVMPAR
jgi:tetratricopeptide (TPR) repeat protein